MLEPGMDTILSEPNCILLYKYSYPLMLIYGFPVLPVDRMFEVADVATWSNILIKFNTILIELYTKLYHEINNTEPVLDTKNDSFAPYAEMFTTTVALCNETELKEYMQNLFPGSIAQSGGGKFSFADVFVSKPKLRKQNAGGVGISKPSSNSTGYMNYTGQGEFSNDENNANCDGKNAPCNARSANTVSIVPYKQGSAALSAARSTNAPQHVTPFMALDADYTKIQNAKSLADIRGLELSPYGYRIRTMIVNRINNTNLSVNAESSVEFRYALQDHMLRNSICTALIVGGTAYAQYSKVIAPYYPVISEVVYTGSRVWGVISGIAGTTIDVLTQNPFYTLARGKMAMTRGAFFGLIDGALAFVPDFLKDNLYGVLAGILLIIGMLSIWSEYKIRIEREKSVEKISMKEAQIIELKEKTQTAYFKSEYIFLHNQIQTQLAPLPERLRNLGPAQKRLLEDVGGIDGIVGKMFTNIELGMQAQPHLFLLQDTHMNANQTQIISPEQETFNKLYIPFREEIKSIRTTAIQLDKSIRDKQRQKIKKFIYITAHSALTLLTTTLAVSQQIADSAITFAVGVAALYATGGTSAIVAGSGALTGSPSANRRYGSILNKSSGLLLNMNNEDQVEQALEKIQTKKAAAARRRDAAAAKRANLVPDAFAKMGLPFLLENAPGSDATSSAMTVTGGNPQFCRNAQRGSARCKSTRKNRKQTRRQRKTTSRRR
jgi:hypothetical protein